MTESEPKTVVPERLNIAWLLGAQVVFVLLLAPCDGGRWQTRTLLFMWVFDILFCLVLYGVANIRDDRSSGISLLAAALFVIGSIATAVVGTYAMEGLDLHGTERPTPARYEVLSHEINFADRLAVPSVDLSHKDTRMRPAPREISGARVIYYSPIDYRHRHTGKCRQVVAGVLQGPMAGLAICEYPGERSYYLFGCDQEWRSVTDTWHQTLEEAKAQAEFEYEGVSSTWEKRE